MSDNTGSELRLRCVNCKKFVRITFPEINDITENMLSAEMKVEEYP